MPNLQQLLEQQAELDKAIERTRREEREAAIRVIKLLLKHNGITVADLVGNMQSTKSAPVKAKYRDPDTGTTWSGRGFKPRWLDAALQSGRQLAGFAI